MGPFPGGFDPQRAQKKVGIAIDIKFGDAQTAIQCMACQGFNQSGLFIIVKNDPVLLCVKCLARCVVKFQELHPTEKLFDEDICVDDKEYQRAADAARTKCSKLSDSEAMEVARAVIDTL
jgi:hypothetical protein